MSNIYNTEPPTKGKVVLVTSHGDVDVELWAKEAPKACRNFVQLCLEGYYDGTVFHRILPNFMIQGGDPTGTGTGGESIYGGPFADEFHSRLRFAHRGIVAMANENVKDSNGSQFFITLDKTEWLDRKHSIFGKVTGDTIYNVADLGKLETDGNDRPTEPMPHIKRVDVIWNPFDDIVPRQTMTAPSQLHQKRKRKQKKNLNLLSFGAEAEQEEAELAALPVAPKILSSHDALTDDKRLVQAGSAQAAVMLQEEEARWEVKRSSLKDKIKAVKQSAAVPSSGSETVTAAVQEQVEAVMEEEEGHADDAGLSFAQKMRAQMVAKRKARGDTEMVAAAARRPTDQQHDINKMAEADAAETTTEAQAMTKAERRAVKEARKLSRMGASRLAATTVAASVDGDLITDGERLRREIKAKKKLTASREKDTLAKLAAFQKKFAALGDGGGNKAAAAQQQQGEGTTADEQNRDDGRRAGAAGVTMFASEGLYYADDNLDEGDAADWMGHELSFVSTTSQPGAYVPGADDYVVEDPLLEKGKGKFSKEEQKRRKRNNSWAGKSRD